MKITVSDGSKEAEQLPLYEFTEDNVEVSPKKETVKMYKMSLPQSCCTTARQLMVIIFSVFLSGFIHFRFSCLFFKNQKGMERSLELGTYSISNLLYII